MDISLNFRNKVVSGEVNLPASKSISNRVLIVDALASYGQQIENLADCDDTVVMQNVLESDGSCFDIGHAGTAMRFLTAFLAQTVGRWEITGSERMKQRPIGVLVDALNELGGKVEYKEKAGYPPLLIYGRYLRGGEIEIPASVSSQYISALMMIAPYMDMGLKIILKEKVVSRTYLMMTLQIMRKFGAEIKWEGQEIIISPKPYTSIPFKVEADWSGASYFYELLAIADGGEIRLPGLMQDSYQGDAGQVAVWERLGVETHFDAKGAVIKKIDTEAGRLEYDFVEMPDLVQSFAVACCLKNIPFVFTGVETLRIKETDRIAALVNELAKLGYVLEANGDNELAWRGMRCDAAGNPQIATYHDHRMAMAFASAAIKFPGLVIEDKNVVTKSFPAYWEELDRLCKSD